MSIFNSVDIISGSLNIYKDGTAFASQSAYIIRQGIETTGGIKGDTLSITTTNPPTASGGFPIPLLAMGYSDTTEAPRIGIGTSSPKTLLQIESPSSSIESPDIILSTPSESVSVGDETGRITFSIADTAFSSSGVIASGSTSAIYSKVLGTGVGGSYGSLVFEVNDNNAVTEPIKGMELGYGIVNYSGLGLAISGNVDISTESPILYLRNTGTGYPIVKLGYNSPTDFSDGELLLFTQGTASVKLSADSSPQDDSFIYYGNLGLGTYTPSEKLEVIGNTLISGSLKVGDASNYLQISSTGDLTLNGTADYLVGANRYAFRFIGDEDYGLYFNASAGQYEFKNFDANSIFSINAGNGDTTISGSLTVENSISGSGGAQLDLAAYEFGYEISTSFPITGSGLIVSSSNLPANHYNMVKIGETELLDINSALSPNTFFIHNVDTIIVASGSEPVNIYGESPGKLFEHNSSEFKVYSDDGLKLTISSGSSAFTHEVSAQSIRTAANLTTSPQYVAVWESSPQTTPQELKYVTASTFTGGGGSSPYSLGTFGGRYNWSSTEGDRRIAHGYINGPTAGASANDDNFGPYSDTHTIDSTTQTFNAYKMQYYAIYSPVAGVPHIKAWGRSTDTDFATNGCEMGVSVWSVDTEPSNGSTTSPTATLRATSPTFTIPNSTVGYLGNGMEASGSSSLPAGTFYLVTFDLSGSLADAANIYINFHLWIE